MKVFFGFLVLAFSCQASVIPVLPQEMQFPSGDIFTSGNIQYGWVLQPNGVDRLAFTLDGIPVNGITVGFNVFFLEPQPLAELIPQVTPPPIQPPPPVTPITPIIPIVPVVPPVPQSQVPEPRTLILIGGALISLSLMTRARRRNQEIIV